MNSRDVAMLMMVAFMPGCDREARNWHPPSRLTMLTNEPGSETDEHHRIDALLHGLKQSYAAGNTTDARRFAEELLQTKNSDYWNYGNAIHVANSVLGHLAIRERRIEDAKLFLLASANISGSPQLASFGPSMKLARSLLMENERNVVLQYLRLCEGFWKNDRGRLKKWAKQIESGVEPDFGLNSRIGP